MSFVTILAFVAVAASVPEYILQSGDLIFVQPPLDATLPLDSAILAWDGGCVE